MREKRQSFPEAPSSNWAKLQQASFEATDRCILVADRMSDLAET